MKVPRPPPRPAPPPHFSKSALFPPRNPLCSGIEVRLVCRHRRSSTHRMTASGCEMEAGWEARVSLHIPTGPGPLRHSGPQTAPKRTSPTATGNRNTHHARTGRVLVPVRVPVPMRCAHPVRRNAPSLERLHLGPDERGSILAGQEEGAPPLVAPPAHCTQKLGAFLHRISRADSGARAQGPQLRAAYRRNRVPSAAWHRGKPCSPHASSTRPSPRPAPRPHRRTPLR